MIMQTDLTFITNEGSKNLLERFKVLIKDTRLFDVLVGYFYTSGFYAIYESLETAEKIRILIGISTNKATLELVKSTRGNNNNTIEFSHAETKQKYEEMVKQEYEQSEDSRYVEKGTSKFVDWLKNGKLEIRAYPTENIHAKVYIMTFAEGDRDIGRVITGSSNFTLAGLVDNLEFNVELKNRADYDFVINKFNELWENSVDLKDRYIETIRTGTWISDIITPYELYLKLLYEYFKDDLGRTDEVFLKYLPIEFIRLEYQEQAVTNAKKILEEYGGVFISDVVGLGKTFVSAMLAGQLDGRTLVIAPPVLLDKNNPGSWPNVFSDFHIAADYESVGKLESLVKRGTDKYQNVIIDEAHRFRTETNISYEFLAEICRGKRVILVTATPYNNLPKDILSQIKLFQKSRKSTIPGLPDLETFFMKLEKNLKGLDRQKDYTEYMKVVRQNAKEIREKVLKCLMVRRTRTEIVKYFSEDLKQQGFKFPEVANPEAFFYELNDDEDRIFNETIELIAKKFYYARYTPMLYYTGKIDQLEKQAQMNMLRFMKVLLIKRLESSFFAFRNTIDRFIYSYEQFIQMYDKGNVYVSKKYINKIFELLENDDDEAVQRLIEEGKADKYDSREFREDFRKHLESDLKILKQIKYFWESVKRDPKLLTFLKKLSTKPILKDSKLIIFTESKETAEYLSRHIEAKFPKQVICFHGNASANVREKVIENFDAKARFPKEDYRILISTEVLSEGVNLHRSNVVINYDIPWNPTRMMQRVGRINRVDTKFDKIYTFNFFPTRQSNDQIKLKEAAQAKIQAFITLLGADARLLTEGEEITSHELFDRLTSAKTLTGEDETEETELKYLNVIKNIRDKEQDLFERIKRLPKKARTARMNAEQAGVLLTYFRKAKIQKFFLASEEPEAQELDFMTSAKLLESETATPKQTVSENYFDLLDKNKKAFDFATAEDLPDIETRWRPDSAIQILFIFKNSMKDRRQFTDDQELYYQALKKQLEEGGIPKQTANKAYKAVREEIDKGKNPLKILGILRKNIPDKFLSGHFAESGTKIAGKREVILSEYFTGE